MEMENAILDGCNKMGCLAIAQALQYFDTDGDPIKLGEVKMTVWDKTNKIYQTPYGGVPIQRMEKVLFYSVWKKKLGR